MDTDQLIVKDIVEQLLDTFRAQEKDSKPPILGLAAKDIGMLLGYLEIRALPRKALPTDDPVIGLVQQTITAWQHDTWSDLLDQDDSASASEALRKVISDFSTSDRSEEWAAREANLVKGFLESSHAYGHANDETARLKKIHSGLTQHYDRGAEVRSGSNRDRGPTVLSRLLRNWYLLVALGLSISLAVLIQRSFETSDTSQTTTKHSTANKEITPFVEPPEPTIAELREKRAITLTKSEKALIDIDDEKAAITVETDPEKIAYHWLSIGNLYYSKVKDYEKAAEAYSKVVDRYPDTGSVERAFSGLTQCYRYLGDKERERLIYKEMVNFYPKDSEEYKDAVETLDSL